MAVNRNIVRWVREDQIDAFVAQQCCIGVCVASITTNEPMATQDPKVSWSVHSQPITFICRDPICGCRIGTVDSAIACFVQDDFGLCLRKSGELDVKIELDKTLQFNCKYLAVPAGVLRQFVVGKNVGPPLGIAQM